MRKDKVMNDLMRMVKSCEKADIKIVLKKSNPKIGMETFLFMSRTSLHCLFLCNN